MSSLECLLFNAFTGSAESSYLNRVQTRTVTIFNLTRRTYMAIIITSSMATVHKNLV